MRRGKERNIENCTHKRKLCVCAHAHTYTHSLIFPRIASHLMRNIPVNITLSDNIMAKWETGLSRRLKFLPLSFLAN